MTTAINQDEIAALVGENAELEQEVERLNAKLVKAARDLTDANNWIKHLQSNIDTIRETLQRAIGGEVKEGYPFGGELLQIAGMRSRLNSLEAMARMRLQAHNAQVLANIAKTQALPPEAVRAKLPVPETEHQSEAI